MPPFARARRKQGSRDSRKKLYEAGRTCAFIESGLDSHNPAFYGEAATATRCAFFHTCRLRLRLQIFARADWTVGTQPHARMNRLTGSGD